MLCTLRKSLVQRLFPKAFGADDTHWKFWLWAPTFEHPFVDERSRLYEITKRPFLNPPAFLDIIVLTHVTRHVDPIFSAVFYQNCTKVMR